MDVATVETGLLAWAAQVTGAAAACCWWDSAKRPVTPAGAVTATLSWLPGRSVGIDHEEWAYDEAAGDADPLTEMTPTSRGVRVETLQLSVESSDLRAGYSATAAAQRVVRRARGTRSRDALRALNLGLADVRGPTRADYPFDGRMVSRALVELSFNAPFAFTDTDARTASIESVALTSTITDPAGAEVSAAVEPGGTLP